MMALALNNHITHVTIPKNKKKNHIPHMAAFGIAPHIN